jgi:ribosome-binding factor A
MQKPHRRERIAREISREAANIIHQELKDPRIGFISVTKTDLSKDGKYAKIFVSVLGGQKEKHLSIQALSHARGFVQREIARHLAIRECPIIRFVLDDSIEKTFQVTKLIDEAASRRVPEESPKPQEEE